MAIEIKYKIKPSDDSEIKFSRLVKASRELRQLGAEHALTGVSEGVWGELENMLQEATATNVQSC